MPLEGESDGSPALCRGGAQRRTECLAAVKERLSSDSSGALNCSEAESLGHERAPRAHQAFNAETNSFLWEIGRAVMSKVDSEKGDSIIQQHFDPQEFFPVVLPFKEKFIILPLSPVLDLGIGFGR